MTPDEREKLIERVAQYEFEKYWFLATDYTYADRVRFENQAAYWLDVIEHCKRMI